MKEIENRNNVCCLVASWKIIAKHLSIFFEADNNDGEVKNFTFDKRLVPLYCDREQN